MTAEFDLPQERRRFYLIVASMVLTFAIAALVLAIAVGVPGDLGVAFTLGGIAGILVMAVLHPGYRELRTGAPMA